MHLFFMQGARLVAVGLGSPANARRFSEVLDFPLELLYADPSGSCYSALGFRCAWEVDCKILRNRRACGVACEVSDIWCACEVACEN